MTMTASKKQRAKLQSEYEHQYQLPTPTPLDLASYAHALSIGGTGYNPRSVPMGFITKDDDTLRIGILTPHHLHEGTLSYVQSDLYPQYHSNFAGFIIMACAKYFPTYYCGSLKNETESITSFINRLFGGGYTLSHLCGKSHLTQYEAYKLWLRTIHFTTAQ